MARQKPDRSGPLTPEQARTGYRALRTSILGGLASAWGVFAVIAATRPGVLILALVAVVLYSASVPLVLYYIRRDLERRTVDDPARDSFDQPR